jgi:hypothetical protein
MLLILCTIVFQLLNLTNLNTPSKKCCNILYEKSNTLSFYLFKKNWFSSCIFFLIFLLRGLLFNTVGRVLLDKMSVMVFKFSYTFRAKIIIIWDWECSSFGLLLPENNNLLRKKAFKLCWKFQLSWRLCFLRCFSHASQEFHFDVFLYGTIIT